MNILHYNCVLTFTKNKRGISSILRYALHWMLPWDFKRFNGKKGIYHILLKIQSQSCKMYVHTYGCFSTENSFKENLDEEGKHGWKVFVMENKCSFLFNKKKAKQANKDILGSWHWYIFRRNTTRLLCCSSFPTRSTLPWVPSSTSHRVPQGFIKQTGDGGQAGSLAHGEKSEHDAHEQHPHEMLISRSVS